MRRREFLRTGAWATVGLTGWTRTARAASRPEFSFSVATVAPRGSSFHLAFQTMAQKWRDGSGGKVGVTLYPGTQGGEPAIVRRMGIQQLQGAMLTASGMGMIEKSATALQLMPMMFRSWAEVDHVRDIMRPRLEQALHDRGYTVLFWGDAGWVRWFTKRPLLRPGELRQRKIFAVAGDTEGLEIVREYYDPVPLEPDKIFTALTTGMIEGVALPAFLANFTQVATVARHMLDLKYVPVTGAMIVSRRSWERLPADLQATLRTIAEDTGAAVRQTSRAEDDAAIQAMQEKQGLQVTVPDAAAVAEWERVMSEAYPRIRGKIVPAPLFDEVQSLLTAFRSRSGA